MNLAPIVNSLMYFEKSSFNYSTDSVFCSFEQTNIIHIGNIFLFYNSFSILRKDSLNGRVVSEFTFY